MSALLRTRISVRRLTLSALLALALLALAAPHVTVPAAPPMAAASAASTTHPFSNPVWYPLRDAAVTNCVVHNPNCAGAGAHSYWAMDIGSKKRASDEPVLAMGAGVVHIGGTDYTCGRTESRGAWVWIDHGAGITSQYGHLAAIKVHEGQYVTPTTQLAVVGHSGYANCKKSPTVRFLYIAVTHGGIHGNFVEVQHLAVCVDGTTKQWPQAVNPRWATWDEVPKSTELPATSSRCIPASAPRTSTPPTGVAISRSGSGQLTVRWNAPVAAARVARTMVELDVYHPTTRTYGTRVYRSLPGGQSTEFTQLTNGRPYRVRVSFGNSAGWSGHSAYRSTYPAGLPSAAAPVRWVTPSHAGLRFAWSKSNGNGASVSHYQLGIRYVSHGRFTPWRFALRSAALFNYNWTGLHTHTRYQVAVRAISTVGSSSWLKGNTTTG